MLKRHLVIVLTEPKNMLIRHAVFHFKLFQWFMFLAECKSARSSVLLMLAGVHALRHCMDDHLSAICQTA